VYYAARGRSERCVPVCGNVKGLKLVCPPDAYCYTSGKGRKAISTCGCIDGLQFILDSACSIDRRSKGKYISGSCQPSGGGGGGGPDSCPDGFAYLGTAGVYTTCECESDIVSRSYQLDLCDIVLC
jgi:hypothetical protein